MPKPATGHVRWVNGQAIARIRVGNGTRVDFALPTCTTDAEARERAQLVATLAKRLRTAHADEETKRKILDIVAVANPSGLRTARAVAEELLGGKLEPMAAVPVAPTFKQLCEQWTSGELARHHPDQIRVKRSADDDVSRLTNHVYPVIGDVAIDRLTLDHCEAVMRRLPPSLAIATRRNIGQLMMRALRMAVYPLRLIATSPIPTGFLPTAPKQKALAYLYPDEDRRLLACRAVPVEYRMLWGFLVREGMREGEALSLTWSDVDLERGAVRLDRNKTADPRAWAMAEGTTRALRRFRELTVHSTASVDRVFVEPRGRTIVDSGALGLPALLRSHLRLIGLHNERPELFTSTPERKQMRVHDLRATFVTLSLASGRSESWIADRTGHRSSIMIARYKRMARTFAELQTGEVIGLDIAVPELAIDHGLTTKAGAILAPSTEDPETLTTFGASHRASPAGFEPASPT